MERGIRKNFRAALPNIPPSSAILGSSVRAVAVIWQIPAAFRAARLANKEVSAVIVILNSGRNVWVRD